MNAPNNLCLGFTFPNKSSKNPDINVGREDNIIKNKICLYSKTKNALIKTVKNIESPPSLGVGDE